MSGKILAKNELSVEEDKMNAKASMCKFRSVGCLAAFCLSLWGGIGVASDEPDHDKDSQRTTAEDFLRLGVRPIAIGHHGVGPNSGANPALPIENTVDSVRQAYSLAGVYCGLDRQIPKSSFLCSLRRPVGITHGG